MLDHESERPELDLVGICGSLRRRSYNRALLVSAAGEVPSHAFLDLVGIHDIPLFDEDLPTPDAVLRIRERIRAADGLVLACPEYNGGMTGVLKNLLDWLSYPHADSVLRHKPVAILGASTGMLGTARAQGQLRAVLGLCGSRVVLAPEVLVARADRCFDDELQMVDESTRRLVGKLMGRLVREAGEARPSVAVPA